MSAPDEINRINILNEERIEHLEDALWRIQQWVDTYPLPPGESALDAASASNMRHVLEGIRDIVTIALWQPLVRP